VKVRHLGRPLLRGHVWRIQFQSWERPRRTITKYAVILQEGTYFQNYESVCVVLLSTTPPKRKYKTSVLIPKQEHGAHDDVWAECGQVYTVPVTDLKDYQYQLSRQTMDQIDEALMWGLGLVSS